MPRGVITLPPRGRVYSNPGSTPALKLTNNFEGPAGATVTIGNSGGNLGNAFDFVTIGGGDTLTYDTSESDIAGALSGKFVTGASGSALTGWTVKSLGLQTQVWFRAYMYFTAFSGNCRVIRFLTPAGTLCGSIQVNGSGKVQTLNSASAQQTISTLTLPANKWFRLEGFFTGSSNAGRIQVQIFTSNPYGSVADETNTTGTNISTGGVFGAVNFGNPASVANYTFWMDDIGVSNTGPLGAVAPPGAASLGHPVRGVIPQTFSKGRSSGTVPKIIQLVNTAEGGTAGTTISTANSGGASGAGFDAVSIGGGTTGAFDYTETAHGTLAYKFATGSSAAVYGSWTTSIGTQSQLWFRYYVYVTAVPTALYRTLAFLNPSGSTLCGAVSLTTSNQIVITDSGDTARATITSGIPLNQWFRLEGFIIGSATAGQVSLSLFTPKDSVTPVETHTSAASFNTTGFIGQTRWGVPGAAANAGPLWLDDIGVSNTGYLGPAGLPSGAIFYSLPHPVRAVIPGRIIGGGRLPSQHSTPPYMPPVNPKTQATGLDGSPLPSLITTFPGNL